MDLQFEQFLAKSNTITVFSDVHTPSPGFSTTTVTPAKEELGPGWAMDDVYPPLAELRRALLTDEEWAAMSSWEKDVWEMFYRPDWERLACIEQILVDTPVAERQQRHAEILDALRSLGASTSVAVDHLDGHVVSADAALSAIIEEGPEIVLPTSTGFITTAPTTCSMEGLVRDTTESRSATAPTTLPTVYTATVDIDSVLAAPAATDGTLDGQAISGVASTPTTCSTVCLPRHLVAAPVLVTSSPTTSNGYVLDTNYCEFYAVVQRPMPWPSFMDVHPSGDETQPLPWPSFRFLSGLSPSCCPLVMLALQTVRGYSHCVYLQKRRMEGASLNTMSISVDHYPLNRSESILAHSGYMEVYCSSLSCGYMFRNGRILELKMLSVGPMPEVFVNCATYGASYWPGNFVPVVQTPVPGQDIYRNVLAEWHLQNQIILTRTSTACITEWILTPWDPGQEVVLSKFTKVSCSQVCHCICLKKLMLQSIFLDHTLLTPHKPRPGAQGMRTMLPICESFEISCCCHIDGLDLHETIILTDSGSLFHTTVVLHIGKNSRNRQFAYSAISYDDLLLLIRSTALKYMKLYWLTTTVMTEVFRACFSLQIGVTHLAVHCNCLADRQLDLETKTAWYSAYNYCMMVMNNSSFMNLKLLGQSDDIHLQWWPLCIFPPTDELISKSGILVHEILPADCHWGNLTNQWLYFLWCDIPEADLSGLTICDVLLLHLEDMIHWQIAWQHTHDECRWYPNSKYSMMVVNNSATSALEAHVTAHLSVIEVYRHVLGLGVAYTQEFNTSTQGRVVVLYMPDVPVIIDLECQDLHKSDRAIPLTYSCSLFDATLLRFCGQAQPLGLLLQGGTHANLPSLVICKLKLQNHQDTMQMKKVGLPQFHAFVWHVGKGYHDWQFAHLAIARVHPVSLSVHAYQLGILASTMFSFAWGIFDCISLIAQGISAKLLNCRPSEASGDCGSLHKDTHEAESGCQWPLHFVWTCLSLFYDSSVANTLKKHPLPWDPVGMHLSTSLDRQIVFRFPWDPGIAAAAWGQAAFQGGRGVRVPTLHVPDELQILDELQVADTATRPKRAAKPNNKYFEPT